MSNNIAARRKEILERIGEAQTRGGFTAPVTLIAVTKYHTTQEANDAVASGISDIGENHVQEILRKAGDGLLPCRRHFIGHLQTNKVKQLLTVPSLGLIQSVDSEHLLTEINRQAACPQEILIQVNIAGEEQKFGIAPERALALVRTASQMENIRVMGLMAIMPIDTKEIYYKKMYEMFCDTDARKLPNVEMKTLSMGMSGDFEIAVACGSNMVRVGSLLFS